MKAFKLSYFLAILSLVLGCFVFAKFRSKQQKISKIDVFFTGQGAGFLTTEIVNKLLIQSHDSLLLQQKDMLVLIGIEQQLTRHPMIKTAELYTIPQGKLYVEIEERRPIVRVQGEHAYYIDEEGVEFPLSDRYSVKVPLFYGEPKRDDKQEMVQLLSLLNTDTFLKRELVDFQLENNGFLLSLRNYPFDVFWGSNDGFFEKAKKLKLFCAYTKEHKTIKYKRIDLSYTKQVVAR